MEPLEDETKIPMSDTAEDYYYDQYDGTRGFLSHSLFSSLNQAVFVFRFAVFLSLS